MAFSLGSRHIQTRLVEPSVKSLNSGDVFVLVTAKDIHLWNGKDASIMKKAKVWCILCSHGNFSYTFHEIWMQLCWPKGFSFWRFICLNILRVSRSFMDQVHGVDLYFEVLYRFL